jgi:hypothetical protein
VGKKNKCWTKTIKDEKSIRQKQHRVQMEMLNGGVTQTGNRNVDEILSL